MLHQNSGYIFGSPRCNCLEVVTSRQKELLYSYLRLSQVCREPMEALQGKIKVELTDTYGRPYGTYYPIDELRRIQKESKGIKET